LNHWRLSVGLLGVRFSAGAGRRLKREDAKAAKNAKALDIEELGPAVDGRAAEVIT
jgi:hypothetical protein